MRCALDIVGYLWSVKRLPTLEQSINNWTNTIEIQWVDKKDRVDSIHAENTTDSYTLVNLGSRVTWKNSPSVWMHEIY